MLPLFSFLDHLIPLFCHLFLSHFIHFGLAFFLYFFHSPSPSHWKWTFHNASFLFCHKIKPIYPPSSLSLSPSLPQSPALPPSLLSLPGPLQRPQESYCWKAQKEAQSKETGEKTDFSYTEAQMLVGKTNACHCTEWNHFLTINDKARLGMRWGLRDSLRVNAVRAVELSSTLHVYCCLFTALLLFLCPSCPPSEHVLFSQLLIIEGGHTTLKLRHKLH